MPWGQELRSDQCPRYTGLHCEARFAAAGELNTLWLAPVGCPSGNAMADLAKAGQRLKVERIWSRDWDTIAELSQSINLWLKQYNHLRPHQALNWEIPAEQRAKDLSPLAQLAA